VNIKGGFYKKAFHLLTSPEDQCHWRTYLEIEEIGKKNVNNLLENESSARKAIKKKEKAARSPSGTRIYIYLCDSVGHLIECEIIYIFFTEGWRTLS